MSLPPKPLNPDQYVWLTIYKNTRFLLKEMVEGTPLAHGQSVGRIAAISPNHQRALACRRAYGDPRVPPDHPLLQLAEVWGGDEG